MERAVSLQRGCQFCGKRLRGVTPGAMTILLDGQPLDAAVVICTEHAIEVRRVLDMLRQRSIVAQHARAIDVTQPIARVGSAPTERFPKVAVDPAAFRQESLGQVAPVDAQLPVPLQPRRPRRNLTSMRGVWRSERPQ